MSDVILRQSTQVIIRVGSFMDSIDGTTPETGITLGAADQAEALKAAGAATVDISGNTWAAITGADGWYNLTLTTTDTNTVGDLTIVVQDQSVCLPVFVRCRVIEDAVFDRLYADAAAGYAIPGGDVNVTQISGDSIAADNLEAVLDGTGAVMTLTQLRINSSAAGGGIDIDNSAGPAISARSSSGDSVDIASTGGGGDGVSIAGNTTGHGMLVVGGANGVGALFQGGSTSGDGIRAEAVGGGNGIDAVGTSTNAGIRAAGGSNSAGIQSIGAGTGAGFLATGGTTGHGIRGLGGATSGDGISALAQGDGNGIGATGAGTSDGIQATGGATGNGIEAIGGATSGHGLVAVVPGSGVGSGIRATGNSGPGIEANGGGAPGIQALGNGAFAGIAAFGGSSGAGILARGTATHGIHAFVNGVGDGIRAEGGDTSGDGIHAIAVTAGDGIEAIGVGAGNGIAAQGGANGNGVFANGGATAGDGIHSQSPNNGHGIHAKSNVSGDGIRAFAFVGDGIHAEATSDGDGIEAVGINTGFDINADIEGSISGDVGGDILGEVTDISVAALAQINAEVDTALADLRLDELLLNTASPITPTIDSFWDRITSKDGAQTYDRATDSLEAIADSGGGGPTAAQIADAVWDELRAGHVIAGSFGEGIASVQGNVTGSVGSVAAGGINAASIATGAIDADALATDAVNEIVDQVWDELIAGHLGVGSTGEALAAAATGGSASAAVIADAVWDELRAGHVIAGSFGEGVASVQGNVTGSVGSVAAGGITASSIATDAIDADAIAANAVTEIQAGLATAVAVAAIQADTDDIQLRLPATLNGGRMRSHVEAMDANTITAAVIATDALDADALAADALLEISGATDLQLSASHGVGSWVDTGAAPSVGAIADAVWDEVLAGHLTVGSTGAALNNASAGGAGLTPQQVRDALNDLAPTNPIPTDGSIDDYLSEIQGPSFDESTDGLDEIRDRVDECCGAGGGGSEIINVEGV